MRRLLIALFVFLITQPAVAQLKSQRVAADVYALVGPLGQRGPGNLGNNATFGFVVTTEGVVLIDAGGSYQGAAKIAAAIATVTDQAVKIVINTGGQDHRWFGNSYWTERGARTIAATAAIEDQKARGSLQLSQLSQLVGPAGMKGTDPQPAQEGFDAALTVTLGGKVFTLIHHAPAHTPGDSFVWLADSRTVFAGDIVFVERILGLTADSSSKGWLQSVKAIAALDPELVVPGHGDATDMLTALLDTHDYIANLRDQIARHIDDGGDILAAVDVDQSAFAYLQNFDQLARRNAQRVFEEMEWE